MPKLLLVRDDLIAGFVPAHVEPAAILLDVLRWGMVRRVHRARRPQHHERIVGFQRLVPGDPFDGAIRQILVEVIGLAIRLRRVVVPHDGDELVYIRSHEAVRVVEAFAARPAMERTDLRDLIQRGVVPLADRIVDVPSIIQVVGDGLAGVGHHGVVAREAHCRQRVAAETNVVRIATRHERRPRGRAQRGGMEVVETKAVRRKSVDGRRLDQPAEGLAELGEPHIVEQEDENIRRLWMGADRLGPPLDRLVVAAADLAPELGVRARL